MRLPTALDRYPAKMVSRLADELLDKYATQARHVLDPFCGSGAVLVAAQRRGIRSTGIDVNPVAGLLCRVKLDGFERQAACGLAERWIARAKDTERSLPVNWTGKEHWFSVGTLAKYERLRGVAAQLRLGQSNEGRAVLLSYALSIRLCSRADQRSPKPFISSEASRTRTGKHFDPYRVIPDVLAGLATLHGGARTVQGEFRLMDICDRQPALPKRRCTHIITSPPYINAQDYFRNFKLELHLLEALLPFTVTDIKERFIGTERGDLQARVSNTEVQEHCDMVPHLRSLRMTHPRLGAVVHRYVHDMDRAIRQWRRALMPGGTCVVVCGDNLVGGRRIPTWRVVDKLLTARGFVLKDRFRDSIQDRLLPPKRSGHKGLIKEEVVSAYRLLEGGPS